jgi:DNA-binding NtrC family response regulator
MPIDVCALPAYAFSSLSSTCERLQTLVDNARRDDPAAHISVLLSDASRISQLAWMRLVFRNSAMTLLQVRPPAYATTAAPLIEVVEQSEAAPAQQRLLREEPAPLVEDIATRLDIVGDNSAFRSLLDSAYALALSDAPVLIVGEEGSGKGLLADFIWKAGSRSRQPMLRTGPLDMPDPVASLMLFGGNDTQARSPNRCCTGILASAAGGTLLVENVERLSENLQNAIADFLPDDNSLHALSTRSAKAPARLIFTCRSERQLEGPGICPRLKALLADTTLRIPPLRERRDDIPLLALHFLQRLNASLRNPRHMSRATLKAIEQLPWPGNVCQLRLSIERAALLSTNAELTLDSMGLGSAASTSGQQSDSFLLPEIGEGFSLEAYLGEIRRRLILRALELSHGNQSEAARLLSITPQAVHQFRKFQAKTHKSSPH